MTTSSSSAPSTVRSSVGDGRRPTGAGASSGVGLTGRAGGGAVAGGVLAGSFGEDSIDTDTETISGTLSSFTLAGRSGSGAPRYVGAGRASASGQPGEVSCMCGMREAPAPSRHPSATLPWPCVLILLIRSCLWNWVLMQVEQRPRRDVSPTVVACFQLWQCGASQRSRKLVSAFQMFQISLSEKLQVPSSSVVRSLPT